MVLGIIGKVAPLAPCPQILGRAVLRGVVKVRHRQHNARARDGVWLAVLGAAVGIPRAPLASLASGITHLAADALPFLWVARSVLYADRHVASASR